MNGTIGKKCDRAQCKPASNRACKAGTCQHTCGNPAKCSHKWTLRYQAPGGKQKEASYATRKLAEDARVNVAHTKRAQTYTDPREARCLFADYAATWIEARDSAPGTRQNYRNLLSKYVGPAFEGRSLAQVAQDRDGLTAMLAGMRDRGLSDSRRALALALVRGVILEAQAAGRIATHRLAGVTVPRAAVQAAVIIPATNDQLATLAGGMRPEHALAVWLARGCGLRISEALAVSLKNFRDHGRTLRVSEQTGDRGSLGPLKHRRPGEYRDIPVPSWLWLKVEAHVREFGADDGYLFSSRTGGRLSYHSIIVRFRTAATKAGLPGLKPHGLRHQYASALLAAGVPLSDVSRYLGHQNYNMTYSTYSHLLPDSEDRARAALEAGFEAPALRIVA